MFSMNAESNSVPSQESNPGNLFYFEDYLSSEDTTDFWVGFLGTYEKEMDKKIAKKMIICSQCNNFFLRKRLETHACKRHVDSDV